MFNRHIIHSQKMVISVDDQQDAQKLQLELRNFCRDVLPDLFNEVFDAVAPVRTLRIEQIKLDLGDIRTDHFIADIKEKIISQLYQQLREHQLNIDKSQPRQLTRDEPISDAYHGPFSVGGQPGDFDETNDVSKYEALVHYCLYGLRPWWISGAAGFFPSKMLKDLFASHHDLFIRLSNKFGPGSKAQQRLMALISKQQFFDEYNQFQTGDLELVRVFAVRLDLGNYQKMLFYWLTAIEKHQGKKEQADFSSWILKCAHELSDTGKKSLQIVTALITKLENDKNKKTLVTSLSKLAAQLKMVLKLKRTAEAPIADENAKPVQPLKKTALVGDRSLAVENAGLVLVWPFLKAAFLKLNWLSENEFKDRATIEKAICWLHFLIYEAMPVDESPMLLNKLICGLEAEEALALNQIRFSKKELAEAEEVKQAVIQNWPALKTTVTSALKESFFKRNGLLKIKDDNWYLNIERKGIDVLIDRLPWPIAHVKLPWNNYMIHVNW
ncbi:MAG TPA: contractile injection system tape measure protein [Pedobacter sp.]|uniref:contractile injection system tape measure protein n=1 Tax=Pedobacter sp. TaxID=1411316 RepID=UPI002C52364A|nr:contractile injection system tape measure protein [Pedobacter sp.]HMI01606.1 contractile injection system tape measure protein [Pedobacter sp.]